MNRTSAIVAATALVIVIALAAVAYTDRKPGPAAEPAAATAPAGTPATGATAAQPGSLYGRVTTTDGVSYEGRLRWGGDEEAFWGDYFNGFKDENPWAAHAPSEALVERRPIGILGLEIAEREQEIDLGRPFMARFGDIARIERRWPDLLVTLKSRTTFELDLLAADDLADGLRVWDRSYGAVDIAERRIRLVELQGAAQPDSAPDRLHGTVRTPHGDFTGFVQWDWEKSMGSDELYGHTADGKRRLRFDSIRAIARNTEDGARVTLGDGRDLVLSGTRDVGAGHHGIYVNDRRYGRVLISWQAFERVDFSPAGSSPTYDAFPPGRPLTGTVSTGDGRQLTGRLVYDLDESETTETLDAPSQGVNYTIPFGLIATIVPRTVDEHGNQRARVTLHSGEELSLERAGDLGAGNAGLLVFVDSRERPAYVPWIDIERLDLARPPEMYPPLDR